MATSARRPTLLILNGAPGSGKSTLAAHLAARRPLALALDIDQIKHSLGGWGQDLQASGLQARRLALALARRHLEDGHDVMIGQYLARTAFLEQLEELAATCGARFVEAALVLDAETLAHRLARRRSMPERPEHRANDRFVSPGDASELVGSIDRLLDARPTARRVDAAAPLHVVTERIESLLAGPAAAHRDGRSQPAGRRESSLHDPAPG